MFYFDYEYLYLRKVKGMDFVKENYVLHIMNMYDYEGWSQQSSWIYGFRFKPESKFCIIKYQ